MNLKLLLLILVTVIGSGEIFADENGVAAIKTFGNKNCRSSDHVNARSVSFILFGNSTDENRCKTAPYSIVRSYSINGKSCTNTLNLLNVEELCKKLAGLN